MLELKLFRVSKGFPGRQEPTYFAYESSHGISKSDIDLVFFAMIGLVTTRVNYVLS